MVAEIYGKKNCGICEAAKEKFDLLGIPYEFFNVDEFTVLHDGWRDDGSIGRMGALAFNDQTIPTVVIDGMPYTYGEAMRVLKNWKNEV